MCGSRYVADCLLLARTYDMQIFSLVEPLDLLHLARSARIFRRTLMSRASKTVWQRSCMLHYPDMPSPGDLMSEPAWINLLFHHYCHVCVQPVACLCTQSA